jgi:CoA:oxalate CoA-transferase
MANLPMLTGYRVLDFTQFVAGPTCTCILAELGAEVIKVELAPLGDRSRAQGIKPRDNRQSSQSTYYFQHNHSKKSLALDLKHPRARELLRAIVPKVDVVAENFAPGVMARNGLGYDELKVLHPPLVMCSISLAGQSGPLAGKPGYDYIGSAYAGVTGLIGEPDRSPAQLTVAIGDVSTGVAAAMAIGFALLHRERTGQGQHVESTLIDTYFHMHEVNVPRVSLRGDAFVPGRTGSQHPDGGPTGNFRWRDDAFVNLTVLPHQWPQLVEALGSRQLLDDPRFCSARARRDNNEDLRAIIEAWLKEFPTREAAIAALERHRIPCAPVLTLNEAMREPHLRQRRTVRRVEDAQIGAFDIPGLPVRFSQWPSDATPRADLLGEHNEQVLRELIDLSEADIAALHAEKVLVRDPMLDP